MASYQDWLYNPVNRDDVQRETPRPEDSVLRNKDLANLRVQQALTDANPDTAGAYGAGQDIDATGTGFEQLKDAYMKGAAPYLNSEFAKNPWSSLFKSYVKRNEEADIEAAFPRKEVAVKETAKEQPTPRSEAVKTETHPAQQGDESVPVENPGLTEKTATFAADYCKKMFGDPEPEKAPVTPAQTQKEAVPTNTPSATDTAKSEEHTPQERNELKRDIGISVANSVDPEKLCLWSDKFDPFAFVEHFAQFQKEMQAKYGDNDRPRFSTDYEGSAKRWMEKEAAVPRDPLGEEAVAKYFEGGRPKANAPMKVKKAFDELRERFTRDGRNHILLNSDGSVSFIVDFDAFGGQQSQKFDSLMEAVRFIQNDYKMPSQGSTYDSQNLLKNSKGGSAAQQALLRDPYGLS